MANKLLVLYVQLAISALCNLGTIARSMTYYERLLLLALPFVRIREPIERGHLLCMLSIAVVGSLLVRYRWAVPAVAVAFSHLVE